MMLDQLQEEKIWRGKLGRSSAAGSSSAAVANTRTPPICSTKSSVLSELSKSCESMGSEIDIVQKRLNSFLGQLQTGVKNHVENLAMISNDDPPTCIDCQLETFKRQLMQSRNDDKSHLYHFFDHGG